MACVIQMDCRIIDENVYATMLLCYVLGEVFHLGLIGDVYTIEFDLLLVVTLGGDGFIFVDLLNLVHCS